MSLNNWRIVFYLTGVLFVVIIFLPVTWGFLPRNEEQFFTLATLGEDVTESKYFPNDNSNITLKDQMKWNIKLYNRIETTQYILVKIKILDSKMLPPNNTLGTPSTANSIYEIGRILAKNETKIIPLQWSIVEANSSDNSLVLTRVDINESPIELNLPVPKGDDLRLILELWIYNTNSNTFKFDTDPGNGFRIVWNQIWFKITN